MEDITLTLADGSNDKIEFMWNPRGNKLSVAIDHPWEGDTVTGIGRWMDHYMPYEQAKELRDWLNKLVEEQEKLKVFS